MSGEDGNNDDAAATTAAAAFEAAAAFVTAGGGGITDSTALLRLYGLYKLATVGEVAAAGVARPSMFDWQGRAKWDAWQRASSLGLRRVDAQRAYVEVVGELTGWQWNEHATSAVAAPSSGSGGDDSEIDWDAADEPSAGGSGGGGGGGIGGPRVSRMEAPGTGSDDEDDDDDYDDEDSGTARRICELARDGDAAGLQAAITEAAAAEVAEYGLEEAPRAAAAAEAASRADSSGLTPLHWAADRGHAAAAKVLVGVGAAVDARDAEGMTPLHYAALSEHSEIAAVLLAAGADRAAVADDGSTPVGLAPGLVAWGDGVTGQEPE
ncbi:hypothetical protein HK405_002509 [Cladochytrium tenue]|nr:hypothetical protein HK405_002509 [Cladochytrium tenue]